MNKWIWILLVVLIIGGLGWWGVKSMTDLPGIVVEDQGRDHKSREENEKFTYNSNPPTSGPHDPEWVRPGVYDTSQDKYKLIHSLEHGYVIAHYNCAKLKTQSSKLKSAFAVSAHEDEGDLDGDSATPSAAPRPNCSLGQTLADWGKKIGLKRIIVQPNPEIDKPIVLVAWGRILQMESWDERVATRFAKAFHNKGPEQTME